MRLDRHKPYGLVTGLPGVAFQQDGHYFDSNGHWTSDPESPEPEAPKILGPDGVPVVRDEALELPEDMPTIEPSPVKDDMRLKENKALKLQMEVYGQEWQGVAHAKKFLVQK